jgi:acetyl-CoA carboxylase alpha subunit
MARTLGDVLERQLADVGSLDRTDMLESRYAKFRRMGVFGE